MRKPECEGEWRWVLWLAMAVCIFCAVCADLDGDMVEGMWIRLVVVKGYMHACVQSQDPSAPSA